MFLRLALRALRFVPLAHLFSQGDGEFQAQGPNTGHFCSILLSWGRNFKKTDFESEQFQCIPPNSFRCEYDYIRIINYLTNSVVSRQA